MLSVQFTAICTPELIERRERRGKLLNEIPSVKNELTIGEYYRINDCSSFLEYLRNYQLADVLGKYKLF